MKRLRVGVIFGGRSGEHEVSLQSAASVLGALDRAKYDVVPIGITKDGGWLLSADPLRELAAGNPGPRQAALPVTLPTSALNRVERAEALGPLDVVIPILHGPYGEDGTVQGLLDLADVPYAGSGVVGSAVGMDKSVMKSVFRACGLPVPDWLTLTRSAWRNDPAGVKQRITRQFAYPMFVKPCNLGSSVGITKVHALGELDAALALAAAYDRRVLVERAVPNAREIEVSVLGNDDPQASVCGEIVPSNEFYDYNAKYIDGKSQAIIPADLPPDLAERVRAMAVEAFRAVDAAGFARVDFLLDRE
ncbi:MAG: D-alanine--D-alanine ligase, partial [Actinobacteria bacterium]|nr:D-alanine--D-alanine ligase [Actinomycetota bacterium]